MTREQLQAAVTIRERDGIRYIRIADVPAAERQDFAESLRGSTVPGVEGEARHSICYAHDWLTWVSGYTPGWPEHGKRK